MMRAIQIYWLPYGSEFGGNIDTLKDRDFPDLNRAALGRIGEILMSGGKVFGLNETDIPEGGAE